MAGFRRCIVGVVVGGGGDALLVESGEGACCRQRNIV